MTDQKTPEYRHEIDWLEREIKKLEWRVKRKPSIQRLMDEYRHQLEHTKCQIDLGA